MVIILVTRGIKENIILSPPPPTPTFAFSPTLWLFK